MIRITVGLLMLSLCLTAIAEEPVAPVVENTPVDQGLRGKAERGTLGTTRYTPSAAEKPFFEKLPAGERVTGNFIEGYDILGRKGKAIGWFGIVRRIAVDAEAKRTDLLVEMRYFDGLVDTHIQLVSSHGSGDFRVRLQGTGLPIHRLSLVRVYGTVKDEIWGIPVIEATFVRHWDWGHFSFMAYGPAKGNPEWRSLCRVPDDDIYQPFPRDEFYEVRLGPRTRRGTTLHDRLGGKESFVTIGKSFVGRLRENPAVLGSAKLKEALAGVDDATLARTVTKYLIDLADGPGLYGGPRVSYLRAEYEPSPAVWRSVVADLEAAAKELERPGGQGKELVDRVRRLGKFFPE